jgi:hypothetical protein
MYLATGDLQFIKITAWSHSLFDVRSGMRGPNNVALTRQSLFNAALNPETVAPNPETRTEKIWTLEITLSTRIPNSRSY